MEDTATFSEQHSTEDDDEDVKVVLDRLKQTPVRRSKYRSADLLRLSLFS